MACMNQVPSKASQMIPTNLQTQINHAVPIHINFFKSQSNLYIIKHH